MFIPTIQRNLLQALCGVEVFFGKVYPKPTKIANIITVGRSGGRTSIVFANLSETISVGDSISISQSNQNIPVSSRIPDSFIGNYTIESIQRDRNTIIVRQEIPDELSRAVTGILYRQQNIAPAENYAVFYQIESKVPSSVEANISPNQYVVNGNEPFVPSVLFDAKLRFSKSAKVLIKATIRNLKNNAVLKTEYQEIIVSDSNSKPCEIIYEKPITTSYYELNKNNNWSYYHENYLLAEFIPNSYYKNNIFLRVIKKNDQLLPSRGGKNKIRIVVDPIKLQNKKTTIDKIRTAILNQYDTINNSIAIANLGNKSYDIIVEDKLIKPGDFKDIIVDTVPPETGLPVKFSDVATAVPYGQDASSLPKISILKWNNNYLGELHYNGQLYDRDPILVNISRNIVANLSGTISEVINGTNQLITLI